MVDQGVPFEPSSNLEEAHPSQGEGSRVEEPISTTSPADTHSFLSPSLAPAPLAITKSAQGSASREDADTSLSSAVEAFRGQLESAFDDPSPAEEHRPGVQMNAPRSNRSSFDLDEMISLLPVASHFDISRKPKDRNRPPQRLSLDSSNNDRRMARSEDTRSISFIDTTQPSPSEQSKVESQLQGSNTGVASPEAVDDVVQQLGLPRKSLEGVSVSGSGSKNDNSTSPYLRNGSIERRPSIDSDLYACSITHKRPDTVLLSASDPQSKMDTKTQDIDLNKSSPSPAGEENLSRVPTTDLASDAPPSTMGGGDTDTNVSRSQTPNSRDDDDDEVGSTGIVNLDSTHTYTNDGPPIALQPAPATLAPNHSLFHSRDFPEQLEGRNVRPPSSTAQDSRASVPFRKPVPSNSLRRSELSSPDFVKYSNAEQHGLKIVLTPESETRQRQNSISASAPPPPAPVRPPPPIPPHTSNPLATLSPTTSLDMTRRWSNESLPSRYMINGGGASSIERDESINETLSTVSSSERSERQTISSAMTSATNTIATSRSHPLDSVRIQAHDELHKLQLQPTIANSRRDSTAQKASLQQSMDIIKKAYLPQSAARTDATEAGTSPAKSKSSRVSLKPKKSVALLAMVGRKTKQADLHEAARTGDNDTIRSLLEDRVSVDARGDNMITPQMEAARRSHLQCLQTLKEFNADEFAVNGSGRNVLHLAVVANQPKAVSWLIEAYPPTAPDVPGKKSSRLAWATEAITGSRSSKILKEASDREGSRPLHVAAKLGLINMVSLLLDLGSDIEARDNRDRTPLLDAAMLNRLDIVDLLLDRGADISARDLDGMTALHWAAGSNHLSVLHTLLNKGNARFGNHRWFQDWYNEKGDLPIHSASRNGNVELVKLLKGLRPISDFHTKHGETLLHIAALTNHLPLARELLRGNVDANTWAKPHSYHLRLWAHDEAEYNPKALPLPYNIIPLHYACTRGDFEMTELLLENGAWVNAAPDDDDHGLSPLMMAVESGSTNLVCLLLARGAKVNAAVPATLMTALHFASKRGDLETTRELVRYGAKTGARTKDLRTAEDLVQKIKDPRKKYAMVQYCEELSKQRLAKIKAQMAENRQKATSSLTPQPTPSPQPRQQITYVYPAGTVLPGTAVPTQYMDYANDAFPEAPPAYTPGSNAPRNLANRPGVYRPHYG